MPTLPRRRSRIQHARCDMSLALHFAPGVERLVQRQAVLQQLVIVSVESRQTERHRAKPRRLGRELEPPGIGPAHDRRKPRKRRLAQLVFLQERVETAERADMSELDAIDVVRNRTRRACDRVNPVGTNVDGLRRFIDEARDEPRARQTVDLGSILGRSRVTHFIQPSAGRMHKPDHGLRDSCDRRGVPCRRKFPSGPLLGKSPEQGQTLDAERLGC